MGILGKRLIFLDHIQVCKCATVYEERERSLSRDHRTVSLMTGGGGPCGIHAPAGLARTLELRKREAPHSPETPHAVTHNAR
jgi:hypothetical protein